jgi:hypothetical protein
MVCLAVIICRFAQYKRKEVKIFTKDLTASYGYIQVAVVGFVRVWWQCAWNQSMTKESWRGLVAMLEAAAK